MQLTLDQKRKLKSTGYLLFFGFILGPVYVIFSDGFTSLFPYINSIISGVLIALNIAFYEFIVFTGKVKRLRFYQLFILRVLLYVVSIVSIILFVLIVARMFKYDLNFYEVLISQEFREYILYKDFIIVIFYAFAIVALANFTLQMNRKMGQGVLWNLITGKYYSPQLTERIIMFVKIRNTEEIIERAGRLSFHNFLNEVIFHITGVIIYRQAVIYEYVEDLFVLLWQPEKGLKNANCIRAFFEMQEKLDALKEYYYEKYHFVPELKGALHIGEVIVGEIGDLKSEIKYLGDTLNTTARILDKTSDEERFIGSEELIGKIEIPSIYKGSKLGEFRLKGRSKTILLVDLSEKDLAIV